MTKDPFPYGDPAANMRLATAGAVAECAMNITPEDCHEAGLEIERLRAEIAKLRAALNFYADLNEDGYSLTGMGDAPGEIILDGGARARATLARIRPDFQAP